jgi:hypothetical protein
MTAVENLVKKLNEKYGNDDFVITFNNEISEALELEKRQIMDAYLTPLSNEYWYKDDEILKQESEKYYNKTYKEDNI